MSSSARATQAEMDDRLTDLATLLTASRPLLFAQIFTAFAPDLTQEQVRRLLYVAIERGLVEKVRTQRTIERGAWETGGFGSFRYQLKVQ